MVLSYYNTTKFEYLYSVELCKLFVQRGSVGIWTLLLLLIFEFFFIT